MAEATLAVGTDLVYIPAFAEQLNTPGTRFAGVFHPLELRVAATKTATGKEAHLAGRWAVKEAFIKAWSQTMYGRPPAIGEDAVDFAEIVVRPDAWGRIAIELHGEVAAAFSQMPGDGADLAASISHDGDYATATCVIRW